MKENGKKSLRIGMAMVLLFALWTVLVQTVDVQAVGPKGTAVGFAGLNSRVHAWIGVHMKLYTLTDWLGLVPVFVCMWFGMIGLMQWIRRKSLSKVDRDLLVLGGYYLMVILGYLVFEMFPVNYRPVLIDGRLEASYPSSTTLLVLGVMPTLVFQSRRRVKNKMMKRILFGISVGFSIFMVVGRLISGVHWITDIVGAVLLSSGVFCIYHGLVVLYC